MAGGAGSLSRVGEPMRPPPDRAASQAPEASFQPCPAVFHSRSAARIMPDWGTRWPCWSAAASCSRSHWARSAGIATCIRAIGVSVLLAIPGA
jgi:hypothetical protein